MKIKTSDLIDDALNWAVTKCEGEDYRRCREYDGIDAGDYPAHEYSTNWAQGGPIIEREKIEVSPSKSEDRRWSAGILGGWPNNCFMNVTKGPTPLIAAMRCYVASKLGNEVEIPDNII